jgi:hypothetical protein
MRPLAAVRQGTRAPPRRTEREFLPQRGKNPTDIVSC